MDHIFNIDKPADWTSFDVVKKIRGITRIKKVGHAGTLDPFATGVLLVLTGQMTKQQNDFMRLDKVYEATVQLGQQTDTGDFTGSIIAEKPVPTITETALKAHLETFIGEIEQIPPMFSAKKVNGTKLYKLARKGQVVEREPQRINIYSIDLIEFAPPQFTLRVRCGKGTYIRVLAEDIGAVIDSCAHLTGLRRLSIGDYTVDSSETLEKFEARWTSYAA